MNELLAQTTETEPNNPKIKLHFRGLGMLCFNDDLKRAEIGAPDVRNHDLVIQIKNSDGQTIRSGSMAGKTLKIKSISPATVEYFESGSDPRNLRRLYDLSEIYGEDGLKTDAQYQSKIFIENSVLFCDPLCPLAEVDPFRLDGVPTDVQGKPIASAFFASTKSDNVELYYDGKITLEAGKTYHICISSQCLSSTTSDFKYFYNLLKTPTRPQHNLSFVNGRPSWVANCQPEVWLSTLAEEIGRAFSVMNIEESSEKPEGFVGVIGNEDRESLIQKMDHFMTIICGSEPCMAVTYMNQSRSIPE